MKNKELIKRLRKPTAMPLKLCNEAAAALEQADVENAELRAQVEMARDALRELLDEYATSIGVPATDERVFGKYISTIATLTTGNAVKQIEARVCRQIAGDFDKASDNLETDPFGIGHKGLYKNIAAELRKLAEQREQS